jgi:hypothetical protein
MLVPGALRGLTRGLVDLLLLSGQATGYRRAGQLVMGRAGPRAAAAAARWLSVRRWGLLGRGRRLLGRRLVGRWRRFDRRRARGVCEQ